MDGFLDATHMHLRLNVPQEKRTKALTCLEVFVILSSILFGLWLVAINMQRYMEGSVMTSVESEPLSDFPNIALCPFSWISFDKIHKNTKELMAKETDINFDSSTSSYYKSPSRRYIWAVQYLLGHLKRFQRHNLIQPHGLLKSAESFALLELGGITDLLSTAEITNLVGEVSDNLLSTGDSGSNLLGGILDPVLDPVVKTVDNTVDGISNLNIDDDTANDILNAAKDAFFEILKNQSIADMLLSIAVDLQSGESALITGVCSGCSNRTIEFEPVLKNGGVCYAIKDKPIGKRSESVVAKVQYELHDKEVFYAKALTTSNSDKTQTDELLNAIKNAPDEYDPQNFKYCTQETVSVDPAFSCTIPDNFKNAYVHIGDFAQSTSYNTELIVDGGTVSRIQMGIIKLELMNGRDGCIMEKTPNKNLRLDKDVECISLERLVCQQENKEKECVWYNGEASTMLRNGVEYCNLAEDSHRSTPCLVDECKGSSLRDIDGVTYMNKTTNPCTKVFIDTSVGSSSDLPERKTLNDNGQMTTKKRTAIVEFIPSHPSSIIVIREAYAFTWDGLVSNIGGLLGLACGASLVSLLQVVYVFVCTPLLGRK